MKPLMKTYPFTNAKAGRVLLADETPLSRVYQPKQHLPQADSA
jgi:hypothetical protein